MDLGFELGSLINGEGDTDAEVGERGDGLIEDPALAAELLLENRDIDEL